MLMFFNNDSSIKGPVFGVNVFVDFGGHSVRKLFLLEDLTHKYLWVDSWALLGCSQRKYQFAIVFNMYFESSFY